MAEDGRQVVERDEDERLSDDRYVDSELAELAADELDEEEQDIEERGAALLRDRRRVISLIVAVVLLIVAIYVVLPKVFDAGDALDKLDEATWYWLVIAAAFNAVSFISYMALFRGVIGGRGQGDNVHPPPATKAPDHNTKAGVR